MSAEKDRNIYKHVGVDGEKIEKTIEDMKPLYTEGPGMLEIDKIIHSEFEERILLMLQEKEQEALKRSAEETDKYLDKKSIFVQKKARSWRVLVQPTKYDEERYNMLLDLIERKAELPEYAVLLSNNILFDCFKFVASLPENKTDRLRSTIIYLGRFYMSHIKKLLKSTIDAKKYEALSTQQKITEYAKIIYKRKEGVEIYNGRCLFAEIFLLVRIGELDMAVDLLEEHEEFLHTNHRNFYRIVGRYLRTKTDDIADVGNDVHEQARIQYYTPKNGRSDIFAMFFYKLIGKIEPNKNLGMVLTTIEDFLWYQLMLVDKHYTLSIVQNLFTNMKAELNPHLYFFVLIMIEKYDRAIEMLLSKKFNLFSIFTLSFGLVAKNIAVTGQTNFEHPTWIDFAEIVVHIAKQLPNLHQKVRLIEFLLNFYDKTAVFDLFVEMLIDTGKTAEVITFLNNDNNFLRDLDGIDVYNKIAERYLCSDSPFEGIKIYMSLGKEKEAEKETEKLLKKRIIAASEERLSEGDTAETHSFIKHMRQTLSLSEGSSVYYLYLLYQFFTQKGIERLFEIMEELKIVPTESFKNVSLVAEQIGKLDMEMRKIVIKVLYKSCNVLRQCYTHKNKIHKVRSYSSGIQQLVGMIPISRRVCIKINEALTEII